MVSKTREKLIDVAKQLFVKNGIENTTMNDIANASDKGRRTIYTYFKNKRDIYNAVIERESERLVTNLREIAMSRHTPTEKLRLFLEHRLALLSDNRQDTLRSFFSFEYKRIGRVRRLASAKVNEILNLITAEGVADGSFDREQAGRLLPLISAVLHGIYAMQLHENADDHHGDEQSSSRDIISFIIEGIKRPNPAY